MRDVKILCEKKKEASYESEASKKTSTKSIWKKYRYNIILYKRKGHYSNQIIKETEKLPKVHVQNK